MRAAVFTTVQDYLGYGYLAAQVNHGHKACVKCMDKTPHLQLPRDPGSSKTVFQGTRMWLRMDHLWRNHRDMFHGKDELERAIEKLGRVPCAGKEATEGKAAVGCMESEVCFLGPEVLEDPPHAP